MRECDVVPGEFAQSATTHKCEVSSGRKRAQRMVGTDVRGGALAPDMLLAGRERETKPAATVRVVRLTDQPPRHLTYVLRARRHKAEPRTAKLKRDSEALALADGDIRPERARWPQKPECEGLGSNRNCDRTRAMRDFDDSPERLDNAECVRIARHRTEQTITSEPLQRCEVGCAGCKVERHFDEIDIRLGAQVRPNRGAVVRPERAGDRDTPR